MMLATMADIPPHVINVDEAEEIKRSRISGEHWGGAYKPLTPFMTAKGGRLGVNQTRLPPGRATAPFHYHALGDEAFFVLSGRGVLRYGDDVRELRPGDCVSCPAGTKVAHQIANPFDEDSGLPGHRPERPERGLRLPRHRQGHGAEPRQGGVPVEHGLHGWGGREAEDLRHGGGERSIERGVNWQGGPTVAGAWNRSVIDQLRPRRGEGAR